MISNFHILSTHWGNNVSFDRFQTRIQDTQGRAFAAAICLSMERTVASISARMTAAARTAVIKVLRILTTVHHRTTPRHCRRACTQPFTIPSTNYSWCRVVTLVAITRNPSFARSSLTLVAYFAFLVLHPLPISVSLFYLSSYQSCFRNKSKISLLRFPTCSEINAASSSNILRFYY